MEKTLDEKVSLFKSISNSKESLKKTFEDNLLLYYGNSLFKITEANMAFVFASIPVISGDQLPPLIVQDMYGNPVEIKSCTDFYYRMKEKYDEVSRDYYDKMNALKNAKTHEDL